MHHDYNTLHFTRTFRKDLKRLKKRGWNLSPLRDLLQLLNRRQDLTAYPAYRDKPITGDYAGCRSCDLAPDWRLIYRHEHSQLLSLIRTGTHSDLYG